MSDALPTPWPELPLAAWRESLDGLTSSEVAFHITGQELLGAIEPQIGAGLVQRDARRFAAQERCARGRHQQTHYRESRARPC